jgi:DNA-binding NarL/FixJ family response regulator
MRIGSTLSLVLVDDHAAYRRCVAALLRGRGFAIVGEAHDAAALRACLLGASALADLVLMDVQMPGGGPGFVRELRRAHPRLRVLILSMCDERVIVDAMLAQGAGGYMLKDDAIDDLVEAIGAVASGRQFISRALPRSPQ